MKEILIMFKIAFGCFASFLLAAQISLAAPILQVDSGSGLLTGATGVMVNGTLYDVSFQAGSCNSVFNGCDPNVDLLFTSGASALAASQALLDQVFLGEAVFGVDPAAPGLFDSHPGLIQGCTLAAFDVCIALTPYGFSGGGMLLSGFASNYGSASVRADEASLDSAGGGGTETSGIQTFAVWSLSPVVVPEGPTLGLLCAGLLVLALRRRRRYPAGMIGSRR